MVNVRLPWPPTVNTYYAVVRGRKILSKKGRAFKKSAKESLMVQKCPKAQTGRIEVNIEASPPDRRKRDIDNLVKPILDALTDYGAWEDDAQVDVLRVRRRKIEKPGYVRVHISEIAE